MGQQTLDRPTADVEEHKYKPHGDQAIDCTKDSCKPISMEQLQKDLGPEQFKKYQEHAASEATKNEYFHPESDAGKMMNGFSVSGLGKKGDAADTTDKLEKASQKEGKKDASQENNLFGDERNEIPAGKKQDSGSDKTKDTVSYTHLDVYKRQLDVRASEGVVESAELRVSRQTSSELSVSESSGMRSCGAAFSSILNSGFPRKSFSGSFRFGPSDIY